MDNSPWAIAARELDENGASDSLNVAGSVEIFWHIGAQSFSPYCSGFKPLVLKETFDDNGQEFLLLEAPSKTMLHPQKTFECEHPPRNA